MFLPFSATERALNAEMVRPIAAFGVAITLCLSLLLVWSLAARITLTVASEDVQLWEDGTITALFAPDPRIERGQTARVEPLGQQSDSYPATVVMVSEEGEVMMALQNSADLRLLQEIPIEQVEIVVGQQAPLTRLFSE